MRLRGRKFLILAAVLALLAGCRASGEVDVDDDGGGAGVDVDVGDQDS